MRITSLQTWHWMVVGVVLGLTCGYVHESSMNFADELASYNARRIGQREFERAVVDKVQGKLRFTEITIYPYRLEGLVHVDLVTGLYWDGQTHLENGRLAAHWEPAYFVASVPYRPLDVHVPASPDVRGYLGSLAAKGVRFDYATWFWVSRPLALWTVGCILLIGVVWPVAINLLTFGTLTRPPREKAPSLRHLKSSTRGPAPAILPAAITAIEDELKSSITAPPPALPAQAPVRALSDAPLDPVSIPAADKPKEFGQDKEDFYPTELRGKNED